MSARARLDVKPGPAGQDWGSRAACQGTDTEEFYPSDHRAVSPVAAACCAGCPVRQPCYDYAVASMEQWGVWGGVNFGTRGRRRGGSTGAVPAAPPAGVTEVNAA